MREQRPKVLKNLQLAEEREHKFACQHAVGKTLIQMLLSCPWMAVRVSLYAVCKTFRCFPSRSVSLGHYSFVFVFPPKSRDYRAAFTWTVNFREQRAWQSLPHLCGKSAPPAILSPRRRLLGFFKILFAHKLGLESYESSKINLSPRNVRN